MFHSELSGKGNATLMPRHIRFKPETDGDRGDEGSDPSSPIRCFGLVRGVFRFRLYVDRSLTDSGAEFIQPRRLREDCRGFAFIS
jgi:hypothetical protein